MTDEPTASSDPQSTRANQRRPSRRQRRPSPLPAWAERCLTRADEIQALADWAVACDEQVASKARPRALLRTEIGKHLACARSAARETGHRLARTGARLDTTMSRLDAAEAELLNLTPADYIAGQLPSIVNHVARHLQPTDPRRVATERIFSQVDAPPPPVPPPSGIGVLGPPRRPRREPDATRRRVASIVEDGRVSLVTAMRGASSAAMREQTRAFAASATRSSR